MARRRLAAIAWMKARETTSKDGDVTRSVEVKLKNSLRATEDIVKMLGQNAEPKQAQLPVFNLLLNVSPKAEDVKQG